jgi:transposase
MTQINNQSQRKKKRKPMVVGIDIHPDMFTASMLAGLTNREASVVKRFKDIPTEELERWARKHLIKGDIVLFEAGNNSFEAVRRLEALGLTACVLESRQIGQIADSFLDNDVIASERIARAYLTGMTKVVWVPDDVTAERRELLHAYNKAQQSETRAVNALKSYLNQFHIRLGGKNPRLERNRLWVEEQREWSPLQKKILDSCFDALTFATAQTEEFYQMICREVIADPMMCGCLRILGIGPINAFAIVATVGDINRFSSPGKLVNYLGLHPGRKTSGKQTDVKKGIGLRGRKEMRTLLIQGAQAVMRQKQGSSTLRDWGWRLFLRKGNRNVAVAAVARKMTIQLWHLLKGHGSTFEEQVDSLKLKLTKILRKLGKEFRQQLELPANTAHCVEVIMLKIDGSLTQKV